MKIIVIDTENDTYNKGSPFDVRFNPVVIGCTDGTRRQVFRRTDAKILSGFLSEFDVIVGFNLKYDLHVLRKWGVPAGVLRGRRAYCCQVAQYILERQSKSYPSLEETARTFGIGGKLNEVEELWKQGIQTSEIPQEILDKYVLQDVDLTYQIFLKQQQLIKPSQAALIRLAMLDLLCLEDIEWNGLKYDSSGIKQKADTIETEISNLQSQLNLFHTIPNFNWNSPNHLSALLFGGEIVEEVKVPDGHYKTGKKAGEIKYKKEVVTHHLPRLFKPVKKTDSGKYSTDEDVLVQLGDSDLVKGILKIKELQKLNSTYFQGFLTQAEKFHFEPDYIHANFNQVVTRTGRLSSSKPNLQNTPEELDEHFISRF